MGQAIEKKCPLCGKPTVEDFRPFCSKRCLTIDLGGWLGEKYKVPTEEAPEQSETLGNDEE